jgi:UDP-N-acetylmuramate--alanine ligase
MKKLKIHFVGIKGVGMTPLALIAKEAGFIVSGSDVANEFITDAALREAEIVPLIGFSEENIKDYDLVVITGAHGGYDNPEVVAAKNKDIKIITQAEAVGLFMEGGIFGRKFIGISIAGTHGKTTTSAMIATLLKETKLDPSYVIGTGDVKSLGAPGHLGKGKYFVAEADEYATEPKYDKKAKFLWQSPKLAVITNIEFDHPDIYNSLEEIENAYLSFAQQLGKGSVLITCGDDPQVRSLIKNLSAAQKANIRIISYGFNKDNNYILDNVRVSGDHMFFNVSSYGTILGDFMLNTVGDHNGLNALAGLVTGLELGLSIEKIKKGLIAFAGSKRRLELVGELTTGAIMYDDYAHHPTEIKKTCKAIRAQFPKKNIAVIFQPHTFSRTKMLFNEFLRAFEDADIVILTDIYASLREKDEPSISSEILKNHMKNHHKQVFYLPALTDVVKYLNEKKYRSDTVLVTMGAGDIYKIHSELNFQK